MENYFFNEKTEMNGLINRLINDTVRLFADLAKTDGLYLSMPFYIFNKQQHQVVTIERFYQYMGLQSETAVRQ